MRHLSRRLSVHEQFLAHCGTPSFTHYPCHRALIACAFGSGLEGMNRIGERNSPFRINSCIFLKFKPLPEYTDPFPNAKIAPTSGFDFDACNPFVNANSIPIRL
jgi:hypothetical protein